MTYDCFSFFNELDLLEIRFNILDKVVDFFVLAEAPQTFSGKDKPLYFKENKKRFSKWSKKIIHLVIDDYPKDKKISKLAEEHLGLTQGLSHYHRAFYQKESIKKALVGLKDEDVCYYGDADEIWKPKEIDNKSYKLWQLCYTYFLNNRSSEKWAGTVVTKYKNIRNGCLNDLRANPLHFIENGGWHFTNLGGTEAVIKKLEAYDHQEFNSDEIKSKIEQRIKKNTDYIGRQMDYSGQKFNFWTDESDLPEYLKKNRTKYLALFK